jgi:hypothetical protein
MTILTLRSKGEKITAKAHGGIIDIQGVTVATVDEAVRLQAVDTWFDPLEMFRQIAPGGIVNKEIMNRKVELSDALETVVPQNDGLKIAEEHNDPSSEHANDPAPEDVVPKQISNGTGQPADAFVPHQGADTETSAEKSESKPSDTGISAEKPTSESADPAQEIVASAAENGADSELSKPASNFEESVTASTNGDISKETKENGQTNGNVDESRSTETKENGETSGTVDEPITTEIKETEQTSETVDKPITTEIKETEQTSETVDESRATGTYDAVDEYLESSAEKVHPHPHNMEESVKPAAGEAVAAPANSIETKMTHEEMSSLSNAGECPFLMNRE